MLFHFTRCICSLGKSHGQRIGVQTQTSIDDHQNGDESHCAAEQTACFRRFAAAATTTTTVRPSNGVQTRRPLSFPFQASDAARKGKCLFKKLKVLR